MSLRTLVSSWIFVWLLIPLSIATGGEAVFVADGKIADAYTTGQPWTAGEGYLEGGAVDEAYHQNFLFAGKGLDEGDFQITATLTITKLAGSAASFVIGDDNHFGFEGGHGKMFVHGPIFQRATLGEHDRFFAEGEPFEFSVVRKGDVLAVVIDGKEAYRTEFPTGRTGRIGFRPWRSRMRIHRFAATGNLYDLPKPPPMPKRTQADGYTIPTLDLSHRTDRHVVVERIEGRYLGHPTTLLMPDGKTIYCTYPLGHGGPAAVLKKSTDGGLTWSDRLPVPENWATARNCPCIHRLIDPKGVARLFVFEGNGPMRQSHSTDDGKTWTPFAPNGLHCVVAPITIVPISGDRLLAMYHRGSGDRDRPPLGLWQSISNDGGLTWQLETFVADYPCGNPCEPFVLRSPDGRQLAALARENARKFNSLLIVSNDEGETWSKPVELPAALTGDRHMGRHAPDGRLLIAFRDTALASPTSGDFVAWVGTYDDVVNLREGQYRVRLLRSPKKMDLGYPGVELLPDGTFVATTYAVLAPNEKNSVVSVRVTLDEIDREAAKAPEQTALYASGQDGYHTYRIPAAVVTAEGTVLAFCEGRKTSRSDTGDIDILLRRSTDGGKTFSSQQIVWDDGPNTCGNPCPVVDRATGHVHLLLTHNLGVDHERAIIDRTSRGTRTVWITTSTDDGLTWSEPADVTSAAKRPDWTWYATGPGAGIQLDDGRLIVPCDHIEADTKHYYSHVIYSDDHGKTWQIGGSAGPQTNECEAVQLADKSLLLNMRNYNRAFRARAVATSTDRGLSWSEVTRDPVLVEPICQASIRRYSRADGNGGVNRILFSNPGEPAARKEMTVRLSYDECKTWATGKTLWPGPAAYSCLAVLPNGTALCLYERGVNGPYETITLARFNIDWLTDGEDKE